MFKEGLQKIISQTDLLEEEATQMMDQIMDGACTGSQIGAFMGALATKGETFAELAGAARAMRKKATRVQVTGGTVVDTCGTGGDASGTFNISTTAAFVVAGAGVVVAKHGNRSISSKCGSADVLEALGVNLDADPELVEEAIGAIGIGFMFAPLYHGAMRHAAGPRKELGIRSIFNMLGPLTNPAGANCQLLGVYAPQLTEMFAEALNLLGTKKAFVVHGQEGLDEISVCAPTRVSELSEGMIKTYDVTPEQLVGKTYEPAELAGGDARENAAITMGIIQGQTDGAGRDVVLANAGAALVAAGKADDFKGGIELAAQSIDSGAALKKLEELVEYMKG